MTMQHKEIKWLESFKALPLSLHVK